MSGEVAIGFYLEKKPADCLLLSLLPLFSCSLLVPIPLYLSTCPLLPPPPSPLLSLSFSSLPFPLLTYLPVTLLLSILGLTVTSPPHTHHAHLLVFPFSL